MSENLVEQFFKESKSDIATIQKVFSELSDLFQDICIPYLIQIKGIGEKLTEAEQVELKDKYEQFKLKIKLLTKITQSFMQKSSSILIDENDGFINHIDTDLYEAVRIFETLDAENQLKSDKIRNAYAAYIMLARLLNTMIKTHNDSNSTNTLPYLHNIPDPQFYENVNEREFFKNFALDLNEKLPD